MTTSAAQRARSTVRPARLRRLWISAVLVAVPGIGAAQSQSSSASTYAKGFNGASLSTLSAPVNVSNRDANGNLVVQNGVIQSGVGTSLFNISGQPGSAALTGGVGQTNSGTTNTSGGALAIGNNVSVVTNGSYNTVIVNATQTNTGQVTATTVLNGQINLNSGG